MEFTLNSYDFPWMFHLFTMKAHRINLSSEEAGKKKEENEKNVKEGEIKGWEWKVQGYIEVLLAS